MSILQSVLKMLKSDIIILAEGLKNNVLTDNTTIESVNQSKGTFKGLDLSHRLVAAIEAWIIDNPDALTAPTTLLQMNTPETGSTTPVTQSVNIETGEIMTTAVDGASA